MRIVWLDLVLSLLQSTYLRGARLMSSPNLMFFLFGAVFFLFIMIVTILGARRDKDKSYYFATMIGFLWFLVFVFIILDQRTLAIIFFASAVVVAIAGLPSLRKFQERKVKEWMAKFGQEVDLSAPLRLRDLFTTGTGWLRFVYRWGVGKYVFLMWLFTMPIFGGLLFALNLWLKYMDIGHIIIDTVTYSTIPAIMTYYTLKSALKEQKPPEWESVYRSLNAEDLYRKLLDVYIRVWGSRLGATRDLENKIRSCMKKGLNREDAIRKIAAWEFEGIPWKT